MKTLLDENVDKQNNIWKVKNKYFKKEKPSIPIAKRNLSNTLVTNPVELKRVYAKHFKHRMRLRPIIPKFEEYGRSIRKQFAEIIEYTKGNVIPSSEVSLP